MRIDDLPNSWVHGQTTSLIDKNSYILKSQVPSPGKHMFIRALHDARC